MRSGDSTSTVHDSRPRDPDTRQRRAFGLSATLVAKSALTVALLGTTAALEQCDLSFEIPGVGSGRGRWTSSDVTLIDIPLNFERCGQGRDDKTGRTFCVWCDPNDPFHVYHDWDCDRRRGEIWNFEPERARYGTSIGEEASHISITGSIDEPKWLTAIVVLDREARIPAGAFSDVELVAPGMRVDLFEDIETFTFGPGLPIMIGGSLYDLLDVAYDAGIRTATVTIAGHRAELRTAEHGAIVELVIDDTIVLTRVVGAELEPEHG